MFRESAADQITDHRRCNLSRRWSIAVRGLALDQLVDGRYVPVVADIQESDLHQPAIPRAQTCQFGGVRKRAQSRFDEPCQRFGVPHKIDARQAGDEPLDHLCALVAERVPVHDAVERGEELPFGGSQACAGHGALPCRCASNVRHMFSKCQISGSRRLIRSNRSTKNQLVKSSRTLGTYGAKP